jgi:hypothetical protein
LKRLAPFVRPVMSLLRSSRAALGSKQELTSMRQRHRVYRLRNRT